MSKLPDLSTSGGLAAAIGGCRVDHYNNCHRLSQPGLSLEDKANLELGNKNLVALIADLTERLSKMTASTKQKSPG